MPLNWTPPQSIVSRCWQGFYFCKKVNGVRKRTPMRSLTVTRIYGTTIPEILADYPQLETEDILACIAYSAEMSRQRFVDIAIPVPGGCATT
jgi:Protein of unknown function (DUF433)